MKPFRVSIASTLGIIAVCSLGFVGMREGEPIWASVAFCMTLVFLLVATLKGMVGRSGSRPGPIGFALFGWVYLATVFGPWGKLPVPIMPHDYGVDAMLERLHPERVVQVTYDDLPAIMATGSVVYRTQLVRSPTLKSGTVAWSGDANSFRQSAHSLGALVFGVLGLVAARWIATKGTR